MIENVVIGLNILTYTVPQDIGIKITPEFEKTMETVDKTFADIVRSLNANASKTPSGIKSSIVKIMLELPSYLILEIPEPIARKLPSLQEARDSKF